MRNCGNLEGEMALIAVAAVVIEAQAGIFPMEGGGGGSMATRLMWGPPSSESGEGKRREHDMPYRNKNMHAALETMMAPFYANKI